MVERERQDGSELYFISSEGKEEKGSGTLEKLQKTQTKDVVRTHQPTFPRSGRSGPLVARQSERKQGPRRHFST